MCWHFSSPWLIPSTPLHLGWIHTAFREVLPPARGQVSVRGSHRKLTLCACLNAQRLLVCALFCQKWGSAVLQETSSMSSAIKATAPQCLKDGHLGPRGESFFSTPLFPDSWPSQNSFSCLLFHLRTTSLENYRSAVLHHQDQNGEMPAMRIGGIALLLWPSPSVRRRCFVGQRHRMTITYSTERQVPREIRKVCVIISVAVENTQ